MGGENCSENTTRASIDQEPGSIGIEVTGGHLKSFQQRTFGSVNIIKSIKLWNIKLEGFPQRKFVSEEGGEIKVGMSGEEIAMFE